MTVSAPPPSVNFSLPESLREAVFELRKRMVENHSLAAASAEKLSTIPDLPAEAQALADVSEEHAGRGVADVERICAALDAIVT